MRILTLPNDPESPNTTYRVALDDRYFLLRLRYNTRAGKYALELRSADGDLIAGSELLRIDSPLWAGLYYNPELPFAALIPQTLSADNSPPQLGELGIDQRVQLTILEPNE